jgi:hypothetical protein
MMPTAPFGSSLRNDPGAFVEQRGFSGIFVHSLT